MLRVHFLAIPFDCISFAGKISFANPNSAKFTIPEKTLNLGIYTVSKRWTNTFVSTLTIQREKLIKMHNACLIGLSFSR